MNAQAKLNDPCQRPQVGSVKWWVRLQKINEADFKLKSFINERTLAHLADGGLSMGDYPVALVRPGRAAPGIPWIPNEARSF